MALIFQRQQNPPYDARVAFFQLLLGFTGTSADGLFGPATEAAIQQFQRDNHLSDDGRVDEQTGRKLNLPYWDAQIARNDLDAPFRDPNKFQPGRAQHFHMAKIDAGLYRPDARRWPRQPHDDL